MINLFCYSLQINEKPCICEVTDIQWNNFDLVFFVENEFLKYSFNAPLWGNLNLIIQSLKALVFCNHSGNNKLVL